MLAEHDDFTFRLGYVLVPYNLWQKSQQIALAWADEALVGCVDCAYMPYCGADSVRNHSTQKDVHGFRPTSTFCKKHEQVIEHIFTLLVRREDEVLPIFKRWINNSKG